MAFAHQTYYNSQHPKRPSEKMDSYFPPQPKQAESNIQTNKMIINKRKSFSNAFTQPSNRTISAAKFQRHSRAQSEGSSSQNSLTPPQAHFRRSDKSIDIEAHDEFMYTLHGRPTSISLSSSPLRNRTVQAPRMKRSLHMMPSLSSHFSDDSDSSDDHDDDDDEEEEEEEEEQTIEAGSSSSRSTSSHSTSPTHLTSFTPPRTHDEVESMINNFAILMRSSSHRQRLASVHFDGNDKPQFKRRTGQVQISKSDDEEDRRGRHLNSHWWHEHEEQRSPLGHQHIQSFY